MPPFTGSSSEELWLLGQPPLSRYLAYRQRYGVTFDDRARKAAIAAWRKANDYYARLEKIEAGFPDQESRPLPPDLVTAARAFQRQASFKAAYKSLKTRIGMLDLDRLVVTQPHVNLEHCGRIAERLGDASSQAAVLDCCLGRGQPPASVKIRKLGSSGYRFSSPSSDLRFLEAAILDANQVIQQDVNGNLMVCLGLMVGYSANHLSVIQFGNRFCIHNGHNRAYALKMLGLSHAPCIIQEATRSEEIELIASADVIQNFNFFFRTARPPVMKDFFDKNIASPETIRKQEQVIDINFQYKDYEIDI